MAIRSTRQGLFVLAMTVSASIGCGSSTDAFDDGDQDSGALDDVGGTDGTSDGSSPDTRDGATTDSASTDTATSEGGSDTTVADGGTDTTSTDSAGSDTSGSDTTGSDTAVADSTVTDTTVTDTAVTDTAVADSGTDTTPAVDTSDAPCPAPVTGSVFVSPIGSDTLGNGSSACPFVTITKALSTTVAASGPTTINVASGAGPAAFVYGNGCTAGAGRCDATPIRVTDGMSKGIIIKGSGLDPAALTVVGGSAAGDTAVFIVAAPNVGFANLTIAPRRVASGVGVSRVAGAAGIRFNAPAVASGSEAVVTNVVIDGVIRTAFGESTASGIELANGTSPTIGPGVTIVGGDHSVLVTQSNAGTPSVASKPTITSSVAAPSFFHATQFACVRIDSSNAGATAMPTATLTSASAADPGRLHLQDCGGNGGIVVDTIKAGTAVNVTNTLIDTSATTVSAYYGIRLSANGRLVASNAVTITGLNELAGALSAAIEAGGTSAFGTSAGASGGPGVVVTKNLGSGVHITGSASADVNSLTSTNNRRNGLLCDAAPSSASGLNLFLRSSIFTGNGNMGAFILGRPGGTSCIADLGNATSGGNNVYNTTAAKNGAVGLCYTATTAASATSSTWGCGLAATVACTPATATTPTLIVVAACDSVGDRNTSAALTTALPQTCCGL